MGGVDEKKLPVVQLKVYRFLTIRECLTKIIIVLYLVAATVD